MVIKYSSFQELNITIPNSDKYTSISGSWDSAPLNGGIITFRGKCTILLQLNENNFIDESSGLINLGDLGTYYITSSNEDYFLGYKKISYSFTDILGYLSKTKASIPLATCIYEDGTVNDIINSINSYLGISFVLPRPNVVKIQEPLWLKEGQSLISLLNDILVANGCILYTDLTNTIRCKTIADFYSGLSGNSNENTISKNFTLDIGITEIKYVETSGTKQVRENLPTQETISRISYPNGPRTSIGIERIYPSNISLGGPRKITTTTIDSSKLTKTIIEEIYEDAPPYNSGLRLNAPIKECFPYDPARILSRTTDLFFQNVAFEQRIRNPALKEFANSCNLSEDDLPVTLWGTPFWVGVETIRETWEYNTAPEEIVTNPDTYIPIEETVKYTKETYKLPAYDNISYMNITYGNSFEILTDRDEAIIFSKIFYNNRTLFFRTLLLFERENIVWSKAKGSYRWQGIRTFEECVLRGRFDDRKSRIKQLKSAIDNESRYEVLESDYIDNLYNGISPIITVSNPAEWDAETFRRQYTNIINSLERSNSFMEKKYEETKTDYQPSFSVFPSPYKVYNIPWQNREIFSTNTSSGETISIQAGRFNDFRTIKTVAQEVKNAKEQRLKTLAITNINEIFKIGEIDSPSFSIDTDGVKSSGVYLNG